MHTVLLITSRPDWWAKVYQIAGCHVVQYGATVSEIRGLHTKILPILDEHRIQGYVPNEIVIDSPELLESNPRLAEEIEFRSRTYDAKIKYI